MEHSQFREDELSMIRGNPYPKIAGRLRLVHEQNETLSITTDIVRYDDNIAVVKAECTTVKGIFCGLGMASLERDRKIAPAILELAETRAIARSLRFSGYGVEFCSAEEVSHLNNGGRGNSFPNDGYDFNQERNAPNPGRYEESPPPRGDRNSQRNYSPRNTGNRNSSAPPSNNNGGNGNGNGRLSGKQYKYIMNLFSQGGNSKKEADEFCIDRYGVALEHLSKNDASSLIESLLEN